MATLQELANRLQEYIIRQQESSSGSSQAILSKYSNVKLKMETSIRQPHVIVEIGISRATFNLDTNIKMDGGLGPFERYIRKWLDNSWIRYDLRELYKKLGEKAAEKKNWNNPNAVMYDEGAADEPKAYSPEKDKESSVKSYLRNYLRSFKKF